MERKPNMQSKLTRWHAQAASKNVIMGVYN